MSEIFSAFEKAYQNLLVRSRHVNSGVCDDKLHRFIVEAESAFEALKSGIASEVKEVEADLMPVLKLGRKKATSADVDLEPVTEPALTEQADQAPAEGEPVTPDPVASAPMGNE